MRTWVILVLSILSSLAGFAILSGQQVEDAAASSASSMDQMERHVPAPPLITLEGLEKNTGCFSSRYVVTNTELSAASASQVFLDSVGNEVGSSVFTIPALSSTVFDLASIPWVPNGYSGRVRISSNLSITGTLFPPSSVSGRITDAESNPLSGVSIGTWPATFHSAASDSNGDFMLTGLPPGTCGIVPSKSGYIFSPTLRNITIPPSLTAQDFTGSQVYPAYLPLLFR